MRMRPLLLAGLGFSTTLAFAAPPAPTPAPTPTVTASATGARALTAEDAGAWLDGFMPYALAAGDVAGAVVTIVKDGKILVAKGYGYADVKKRIPVDPQTTLFRQASVSKLITFTAVMQQVEAGKLDLDKDVNAYLDFRIPERDDGPITLRHLMTHTPGFEETLKGSMLDPRSRATSSSASPASRSRITSSSGSSDRSACVTPLSASRCPSRWHRTWRRATDRPRRMRSRSRSSDGRRRAPSPQAAWIWPASCSHT